VTADLDAFRAELDELHALVARQSAILTGVANALRGPPGPLASHSHHDLAERAATVVRERDTALLERNARVARLTDALEARDRAVREHLAAVDAEDATWLAYNVGSATITADEVVRRHAAWVAAGERRDATLAALRALDALTKSEGGDRG
jgi:hypothetical protein